MHYILSLGHNYAKYAWISLLIFVVLICKYTEAADGIVCPFSAIPQGIHISPDLSNPHVSENSRITQNMANIPEPQLIHDARILAPVGEHKFTIIFLHGLGGSGDNFLDVFNMLALPNTRVVLPNAPPKFVTVTGRIMPAWYNILKLGANRSFEGDQDEKTIIEASDLILSLIDYEAAKAGSYKRVFLGGFSQGCSISLPTALRCPHEIGGVVAFSGYGLLAFQKEALIKTKTTPMLHYHGVNDNMVPIEFARATQRFMHQHGVKGYRLVEEQGLGHSLSRDALAHFQEFFRTHMKE